ncbi:laminin subunit gamma-1-like isoform X2 [Scyliorhinus canicula]|uniref:laminin subunit gamma-1-like isoform X2 n=1 Tax=Scyliorhinus canicula TaxID=7830 RepID=UPI0018F3545A|nr:laminin subunit gamma-1-like isoform X2 [Scyliorhinus canicula]
MNTCFLLALTGFIFISSNVSSTYVWNGSRYVECSCNLRAYRCEWDPRLYQQTGSGTRCLNCAGNSEGLHCEKCKENHYTPRTGGHCQPCRCNSLGSTGNGCDEYGRCRCKPEGVVGDKCDKCQPGFYSLSSTGCKRCTCNMAGVTETCDVETGTCYCKYNVEGSNCNRCKPGYYNLDPDNPMGCSACFCFGHSSVCNVEDGYRKDRITSTFDSGTEGWKAQYRRGGDLPLMRSSSSRDLIVEAKNDYPIFFVVSAKFLGNQVLSYGQNLSFTFYTESNGAYPSVEDLILEGDSQTLTTQVNAQNNPIPSTRKQTYNYRLHEGLEYGWKPFLTSLDFQRVLGNLKAIKIRGSYNRQSAGHIDNVILHTARPGAGIAAQWVEKCTCPTGHEGRFCEKCARGYTRENRKLGSFSKCVPCTCRGSGDNCDPETGSCFSNDHPRNCPHGYYVDSSEPSGCRICPCPSGTGCTVTPGTTEIVCVGCPAKTMGKRCEMCEEGYFGNPQAGRSCQPCTCNNNVDPNSVENCDQWTGQCRECLYNTAGHHCERCKDHFYGNALASNPTEKCKSCNCDRSGSQSLQCRSDGTCDCKPGVFGDKCNQCAGDTYFNSTTGCQECPHCYQVVKSKVLKHKNVVRDLEILISEMKTNVNPSSDKDFEERLRKATMVLTKMMTDAKEAEINDENNLDQLKNLNNKLGAETYHLNNIGKSVDETRRLTLTYEDRVRSTERLLNNVRSKVQESKTEMGRMPSLPTGPVGGSNLAGLADEARRLADKHVRDADDIAQFSKAANQSSFEALELITQVIKDDQKTTKSINLLNQQSKQVRDIAEDLDEQANRIATRAQKASEKAQRIYDELNNFPTIDITVLEDEAGQLQIQKNAIELELTEKLELYGKLKNDVREFQKNIRIILDNGEIDQRTAGLLHARANAAKYLAEEAVKKGSYTLEQVDRILTNLRDFNTRVISNKTAAENALQKIPGIIRTIDSANAKTNRAEDHLGNAGTSASDAKRKSGEANVIANDVLMRAIKSLEDAGAALTDARSLDDEVQDMVEQLNGLQTDVANKERSVDGDTVMAKMITDTLNDADSNIASAKDSIQNTMDLINQLLLSMGNSAEIDITKLKRVEDSMQSLKGQWNNELLKNQRYLEEAARQQKEAIAAFDRNIEDIIGDIKNLENIKDTLPHGCFNTAAYERP